MDSVLAPTLASQLRTILAVISGPLSDRISEAPAHAPRALKEEQFLAVKKTDLAELANATR